MSVCVCDEPESCPFNGRNAVPLEATQVAVPSVNFPPRCMRSKLRCVGGVCKDL